MYHPKSQDMNEYNEIKAHHDRRWKPINTSQIRDFFGIVKVIFDSDITETDSDKRSDLVLIGRVKK